MESEFLYHSLVPANIRKSEAAYNISNETMAGWMNGDNYHHILNELGKINFPILHIGGSLKRYYCDV